MNNRPLEVLVKAAFAHKDRVYVGPCPGGGRFFTNGKWIVLAGQEYEPYPFLAGLSPGRWEKNGSGPKKTSDDFPPLDGLMDGFKKAAVPLREPGPPGDRVIFEIKDYPDRSKIIHLLPLPGRGRIGVQVPYWDGLQTIFPSATVVVTEEIDSPLVFRVGEEIVGAIMPLRRR